MDVIRVVSFDVGETLLDSHYLDYVWNEAIPDLYARKFGLKPEQAKANVLRAYEEVGSDDVRWYLPEYWFERFQLGNDPLAIFRVHTDKIRFYPEVAVVLTALSQNFDLVLASGIPTNLVQIMMGNFRHYFKRVFSPVTDLHQTRKTREFYRKLCLTLGTLPSNIAHVGDDYLYDYIIPKQLGIHSFLVDRKKGKRDGDVIADLRELKDKLEGTNG